MFGFQSVFATAMVLAAVDKLSDEDTPGKNKDASGSKATPKAAAKSKSLVAKAKATTKATAKAKSAGSKAAAKGQKPTTKKTEPEDTELDHEAEEEEIVPKKKPSAKAIVVEKTPKNKGLKRPAASREPSEKKFSVCKYMYKNGKWGFKIRGKEVFGVKPVEGLVADVMETIADACHKKFEVVLILNCSTMDAVKGELIRTEGDLAKAQDLDAMVKSYKENAADDGEAADDKTLDEIDEDMEGAEEEEPEDDETVS